MLPMSFDNLAAASAAPAAGLAVLPLAQSDEGVGKLIFAVIFIIIWAISAIASWLKKSQQEQRRRRELLQTIGQMPPAPGLPPVMMRPGPPRAVPLPQRQGPAAPGLPPVMMRPGPRPAPLPPLPSLPTPRPPLSRQALPPRQPQMQLRLKPKVLMPPKATVARGPAARGPVARTPQMAKGRRQMRRAVPPAALGKQPIVLEEEGPATPHLVMSATTETPATAVRPPSTAQANAIAHWLTPQTLRQQYILTELLQQPLALRQSRDW